MDDGSPMSHRDTNQTTTQTKRTNNTCSSQTTARSHQDDNKQQAATTASKEQGARSKEQDNDGDVIDGNKRSDNKRHDTTTFKVCVWVVTVETELHQVQKSSNKCENFGWPGNRKSTELKISHTPLHVSRVLL
jgi:hypothetical protein